MIGINMFETYARCYLTRLVCGHKTLPWKLNPWAAQYPIDVHSSSVLANHQKSGWNIQYMINLSSLQDVLGHFKLLSLDRRFTATVNLGWKGC